MYDLIVIGGGTAGLVASAGAAGLGARVALVERARLGGECLWTGCVPSKALIASARTAHDAAIAERLGIAVREVRPDFARVMEWVRDAQRRIQPHDSPERFRALGVDVVHGTARFIGERTLDVDGRCLQAKRIVIATGSRPALPAVEGLAAAPHHTNETVFALERQPRTLLVLGGGPIGVELAQAFARLGTTVHLVEAGPRLLAREDEELAGLLARHLEAEGVRVHTSVRVTRATHVASNVGAVGAVGAVDAEHTAGAIRLEAHGPDGRQLVLEGDTMLVATGRAPVVDSLELARGGVDATERGLAVRRTLATTARGVWAAGDCVGPLRFTHVADYQARLVVRNAFFPFPRPADYRVVPRVTFTAPELASVGLTEQEARERHGSAVRVWRRPFDDVDRAVVDGNPAGLVKLITGRGGRILGAHVLGHGAGNIIETLVLAMARGIPATALATTIHAYPTYPEAIQQAARGYYVSHYTGLVARLGGWLARR